MDFLRRWIRREDAGAGVVLGLVAPHAGDRDSHYASRDDGGQEVTPGVDRFSSTGDRWPASPSGRYGHEATAASVATREEWPAKEATEDAVVTVRARRNWRRRVTKSRRIVLAEAVAALSHSALSADAPDKLLCELLRFAVDVVGADYGTAIRLLPDGRLRVAKELGPLPMAQGTILPLAPERSYVLRVIETGDSFLSGDLRTDSRVTAPQLLLDRGVVSGLAVPVRGPDGVIGVLALHSSIPRRFNEADLAAAAALASVVATAWEQSEQRRRISHQALHDPLTGLPNRVLFLDRLDMALGRRSSAPRTDQQDGLAVMLVDLDDFKIVNDTYGHAAGDQLLRVAAERFQAAVRPEDTIARLGGDEFGLVCESIPDEATAIRIADRLSAACSEQVDIGGSHITVNASIGITWKHPGLSRRLSASGLLQEADAALYKAKGKGRGNLQLFDELLERITRRRNQLEVDLLDGIDRNQFRLHYQPVRRTSDLHTVGMEALIRWQHPTRGLLPPSQFLPMAEHTGLIVPLGEWVLRTACQQAALWQQGSARSSEPFWVAVNVSSRQLDDPHLAATVADVIDSTGVADGSLVLEVTESSLPLGDAQRHRALTQIRDTGARLFLDDFGTDHASLTHLTQLPIQAVKIDRSFVAGLSENRRDAAVVAALVNLSAELDLQVIAEGVETSGQLSTLRQMRCQAVQGFLFDHPSPRPHLGRPPLLMPVQPTSRATCT